MVDPEPEEPVVDPEPEESETETEEPEETVDPTDPETEEPEETVDPTDPETEEPEEPETEEPIVPKKQTFSSVQADNRNVSFSSILDSEPEGDTEASKEVIIVVFIVVGAAIGLAVLTIFVTDLFCWKKEADDKYINDEPQKSSAKPTISEADVPETKRGLNQHQV